MKLTVAIEARFFRTPDGVIWSESVPAYSFWQRYLEVFDAVEVLARVQDVAAVAPGYLRTDGDRVTVIALPYYIGPYQYLCRALRIRRVVRDSVERAQAVLLRTPGQISSCLYGELKRVGHPYAVEVVGDPHDVFAPGVVQHPLRPFFRWQGIRQLKEQCRDALAAAYVTAETLQRRYPNGRYSTHYSSIDIGKEDYLAAPRTGFGTGGVFRLAMVASLAQLYKAPDLLIDAVALSRAKGMKLTLKIIGDGKYRPQLEERVARLGLEESVSFLGQLPAGPAVRDQLLNSDLFVLPSRTEGLPRAMVEAMACALPCIGTDVGGIPELLAADDLVPAGDARALAEMIEAVLTDPERMRGMSARNLERSLAFRNDFLEQRRRGFYQQLCQGTEIWLSAQSALK